VSFDVLSIVSQLASLVFSSFATPMIIFAVVSMVLLKILSEKYGWKPQEIKRVDILKWAVYGAIIPIWILPDMIFSYINLPATSATAFVLAVAFSFCYAVCRNRGIAFFPIPMLSTLAVMVAASYFFTPPSPEDWSAYSNLPGTLDLIYIAYIWSFSAPPWIAGMAYIRLNPKRGALICLWLQSFIILLLSFYSSGLWVTSPEWLLFIQ